ncbi:MAG: response regulator [Cytophagales bacterium]|nr:MAG: response regulator [Cytophagales bacterium]TAF61381.1 MAG: response regulator [Cytophagales bacterium]
MSLISFKKRSIKTQILAVIMLISSVALALAFFFFLVYDFFYVKNKTEEQINSLAQVIASNNKVSIEFNYGQTAEQDLSNILMRDHPNITEACIYDSSRTPIAVYFGSTQRTNKPASYRMPPFTEFNFPDNYLYVYRAIEDDYGRKVGTVYLKTNLDALYQRLYQYSIVLTIIYVGVIALTYLISLWSQRIISEPILSLAENTKVISEEKDYSFRIPNNRADEIGVLINGFNEMLGQIEEQNLALTFAKEQAEQSSKAKEQFLANMSHEIRTPMFAVMGLTDTLLETGPNSKQREHLDHIKVSAEHLLVLINDILDLSKIESGMLSFEESVIELTPLLEAVTASSSQKINQKKLLVKRSVAPNVPKKFLGDSVRLKQVLINLFSNAVKFTETGEVELGVEVLDKTDHDYELNFFVRDTGIGIPPEKQEYIFSIFTQASSDTTRKYGGTGLGLAICRQLVELQGGQIKVKSELGIGSTFSFSIRYKAYQETLVVEQGNLTGKLFEDDRPASVGRRILLAEDVEINQMLVSNMLISFQHQVSVAQNGLMAFQMLAEKDYDLVLMDVHMPELDGYQATQKIRQELPEPKRSIPIIAITASALKTELDRCISAGMNDYISKPFNKQTLQEKIAAHLSPKV